MKKNRLKIDQEHLKRHDFLNYCKWVFMSIIKYVDRKHLTNQKIHFVSNADAEKYHAILYAEPQNAERWLLNNGYSSDIYNFYYKKLFFSLMVDFSNYYNASIENAFEANIGVAWSLLRKPFQENLAYLEWLYNDTFDLVKIMLNSENSQEYDITHKANKWRIKENINKIENPEISKIIDMYKFRYSYDDEFSLNGILNGANHIVTNRSKSFITNPGSLNFVFLDDDVIKNNIGLYYTSVPYVMFYCMSIIMTMFEKIAGLSDYTCLMNLVNLRLKLLKAAGEISFEQAKELTHLSDLKIYCPYCGQEHVSDEEWMDFSYQKVTCNRCNKSVNTFKYIFEYEKIHFKE